MVGVQFYKLWYYTVAAVIHWPQQVEEEALGDIRLSGSDADTGTLLGVCVCIHMELLVYILAHIGTEYPQGFYLFKVRCVH